VALVVVGALLSTYFWWQRSWLGAIGTLVLFFLADLVLFRTRGNVTVCYRCLAQFRGVRTNPTHQPFDLAIGERYRQERLRIDALRRQRRMPPDANQGPAELHTSRAIPGTGTGGTGTGPNS
jgi:hypothetical protein